MGIDVPDPREKGDQLVDLARRELERGHQPPVSLLVVELRRIREESAQVGRTALLGDLGQIGRVIRTLTEQRVTVDAIVPVPDMLPGDHFRGELVGVRELGKLPVAVDGEGDKYETEHPGRTEEECAGLSLGHVAIGLDADLAVIAKGHRRAIHRGNGHQEEDQQAESANQDGGTTGGNGCTGTLHLRTSEAGITERCGIARPTGAAYLQYTVRARNRNDANAYVAS